MKGLIYYNLLKSYNTVILNCCLFGYNFFPNYFEKKIKYYKKQNEICKNFILFLSLADNIYNKYHIDVINIGTKLYNNYNKYKTIDLEILCDDDMSDISDISDMSDISEADISEADISEAEI